MTPASGRKTAATLLVLSLLAVAAIGMVADGHRSPTGSRGSGRASPPRAMPIVDADGGVSYDLSRPLSWALRVPMGRDGIVLPAGSTFATLEWDEFSDRTRHEAAVIRIGGSRLVFDMTLGELRSFEPLPQHAVVLGRVLDELRAAFPASTIDPNHPPRDPPVEPTPAGAVP